MLFDYWYGCTASNDLFGPTWASSCPQPPGKPWLSRREYVILRMIQQVASPMQSVAVSVFCVKLWCINSHSWLLVTLWMYWKKCFQALVGLHLVHIASLWYHWEFISLIVLMNTCILDVGNTHLFVLFSYTYNASRADYNCVLSPWGSQTSSTRNHNSLTFIYCNIGWTVLIWMCRQLVLDGGTITVEPYIELSLLSSASQSITFDEAVSPIVRLVAAPSQGAS